MNAAGFMLGLGRHSLEAALLVLIVFGVQQVFRKHLSPQWACALWLLVMVRLMPFSVATGFSLFNLLPPSWAGESRAIEAARGGTLNLTRVSGDADAAPVANQSLLKTSNAGTLSTTEFGEPATTDRLAVRWNRWTVLFAIWLGGVIVLGGYVLSEAIALSRRLRRRPAIDDAGMQRVLQQCCGRLGIRRGPVVIESREVATPGLHGLFRPRLLLPPGFRAAFSEDELRFVFLHELAHLQRRDLALNWLATALQVVHWFNPLVWLGFARWRADREIACDAIAVEAAGAARSAAYGHTMLRLLERFSWRTSRPGLIGILESKRDLRRRMRMIANYRPSRRPVMAAALMVTLAGVGLTDAQVEPSPARAVPAQGLSLPPLTGLRLDGQAVMFLVQASDSMTGETAEEVAHMRDVTEAQRRAAPKWRRTIRSLEWMVASLSPDTGFQILFFNDNAVPILSGRGGEWFKASDRGTLNEIVSQLDRATPRGGANLERAFAAVQTSAQRPDRIVLLTDGLPTTSDSWSSAGNTEENRIRCFEVAAKRLPPRIPVSTVLLPFSPADRAAAALYWQLANATRGALVSPSWSELPDATGVNHIAFVIDTSGSMRDPRTEGLWPIAIRKIEEVLDSQPKVEGIQVLDADGRFVLGSGSAGAAGWLPDSPVTRDSIRRALSSYRYETVSNPVPGIARAVRALSDPRDEDMKMGIYVFGDEFNGTDSAEGVLKTLDQLNPADGHGHRKVVINAVGFPTTIRYSFSMGNTGLRFADLMRTVTHEHGGMFIALQDL